MNIVMQAFVEKLPVSDAMRDHHSLALIEAVCSAYEAERNDDANFAAEIMRVIRAIATQGRVTLLSDGPTARLLRENLSGESLLWTIVSLDDDSIPDSQNA